ncbi:EF-Hand 1, calcium-binding site [Phytophthora cactorum]|nr:EF-Hand 1, calcium-binding site [Phytophthora cactorum]
MVRVGVWRSLALLVLCHSCQSQRSGASISIIERHVEPTTFVTAAARSDSEPIWLVLSMLLDVQPVLLKVDVTRHVPAQIQSYCREHGVDTTRCAGAIQEALDEVVNFQRFCKKPTAESALPGFIVTKNVLRESEESASASWLQNDPEDVAIDFCGFVQAKAAVEQTDKCVETLGKALRLSVDWMLALTPCEQRAEAGDEVAASDSETHSVADRLATVEEMIAALQSSTDVTPSVMQEESMEENLGAGFSEEIRESEEADTVVSEENNVAVQEATEIADNLEEYLDQQEEESESAGSNTAEVNEADGQDIAGTTELEDNSLNNSEKPGSEAKEELQETIVAEFTKNLEKQDGVAESEATAADNGSYTPLQDKKLSRLGEDLGSQNSRIGSVDPVFGCRFVLYCVHYVTGHLGAPKQLASVALHDILLLLGGGSRSTLKLTYQGSDDLKKPSSRRSKVTSEGEFNQPNREVKRVEKITHDGSVKSQVAPHHPSPSFTCVAVMLSITNDSIALPHDALTQPHLSFLQDSNEALKIIQHKYEQELAAAQRIQDAWKVTQRKIKEIVMSHALTSEELIEFREIFNLVDRDRGGSITKVELGELMDTLGIDTSPEEIDLMINEIDQDKNGEIDFEEFVAVMSRKVNATYTSEQVKTAFKAFEGNASAPGFIKADKLLIALTTYGADRISPDQAQELISQVHTIDNSTYCT